MRVQIGEKYATSVDETYGNRKQDLRWWFKQVQWTWKLRLAHVPFPDIELRNMLFTGITAVFA